MVNSLDIIPVNRSYSLVSFGNNATLELNLATPEETLVALDGLVYTGGKTNHAEAIRTCRSSLLSPSSTVAVAAKQQQRRRGEEGRSNIMLLITDGYPSMPEGAPRAYAESAALEAKSDGIFIVPITIKLQATVEPTLYLQTISSDGQTIFDVSDFDALDSLEDGLIGAVSCQV